MVINLTVGCQSRASIEMAMIDSFYELSRSGRILVSGAGNEGNTDIHYSGNIQMTDKSQDIIIQVGEQLNLDITLSPIGPDKIGAAIISPGGEMSYIINYSPDPFVYRGRFSLENTSYEMRYIYPWIKSGGILRHLQEAPLSHYAHIHALPICGYVQTPPYISHNPQKAFF